MKEEFCLQLSVRDRDGARQHVATDAPSVLIGSGSHCDVQLLAEDASNEQLRVVVDGHGIFGQVRSLERTVTLNGVPFVEGRVPPGAVFRIGSVEIAVGLGPSVGAGGGRNAESSWSRPVVFALAAVGFPLGFYLLLGQPKAGSMLAREVEPPPLFAAASAARCAEQASEHALALAREELRRAETARERSPFDGQDAVGAVEAFQRAAACFTAAGATALASGAAREGHALAGSVARDFHVHRVRLERALATKSHEDARTEVKLLLSYAGRQGSAYASWLVSLDREIELKFSGKRRK